MTGVQCNKCKEVIEISGEFHDWKTLIQHLNKNGWFCAATVAICPNCSA